MFGKELPIPFEVLANGMVTGFSRLLVIVGDETGIGKSMLAGRTAELVYHRAFGKTWNPKDNLFFKITDLKNEHFKAENRILIIEEAEVELSSDEWQSIQNKYFHRLKATQRIKGNMYILVLPILMDLARKHRRAINYLFDVRGRGFFRAWKITKKPAELLGDELGKFHIGDCLYNQPDCKKEYDELDIYNKQRIEEEEAKKMDTQILLQEAKTDIIRYDYTCPYCKFIWRTKRTPKDNKNKCCPMCKKFIYWDKDHVKIFRTMVQ